MADVFDALYQHWRKVKNPAKRQALSRLLLDSKRHKAEIDVIRAERQRMRTEDKRRGDRNAMMQIATLHELEVQACRELCPELKSGNGKIKTKGWDWVMQQPWAEEFKPPAVERRRY